MSSILYISYTGLMDPLGQSQVLQYVLALGRMGHRMTVLSFEKPETLKDTDGVKAMQLLCKEANVDWRPRVWHNKPIGILATLFDLYVGRKQAIRIADEVDAEIVHCRSYLASLMGLAVKRARGTKLIFDMRGFWPDERVDGKIWSKTGAVYRTFKLVERKLFLNADHIVSLTKAGVREFLAFDYLRDLPPKSTVIPTCTNLEMFRPTEATNSGFTLGYVGSVGSWYLFEEVAVAVARAFAMRPDLRFLVVTKGNHDLVRNALSNAGADLNRVEVRSAEFSEVAQQIARMDAGIFFIRPAWSKRASCPTRMGEFLGCGKPCLANAGVGDVADDLHETGTGIALPSLGTESVDLTNLDSALRKIFEMAENPNTAERCRTVAEERFSLAAGVAAYSEIYQQLSEPSK